MFKRISAATLVALACGTSSFAQANLNAKVTSLPRAVSAPVESDRVRDGLVGPVRRVRTEVVKLTCADGRVTEGTRSLLEMVAYDVKGNKIENQYFPVAGATLTGKETYKYDDKGNISEMILLNDDGTLLSKENYRYEFDFAGNWNKMTTLVAVVDSGKMSFEPTEVTYRSIMYYLDENMVKMSRPGSQPAGQPSPATSAPTTAANNVVAPVKTNPEPKAQPVETASNKQPAKGKTSPAVPSSSEGDDLPAMNSAEIKNVAANPSEPPKVVLDSEPPPSPAPRPILRPVSGGVLNGAAVYLPSPMYPETAKRMRTSGVVTVEVVIDENGKVISANAANGPSTLREAAIQAALRARFSPTKLSGQPVKVYGTISYKFSLAQ
jgi:TonB family protein